MRLRLILFFVPVLAPLMFAQQAPRLSYSPMRDAPEVPDATRAELLTWLTDFQNTVFRMHIHKFLDAVNWREIALSATPSGAEPLQEEKREKLAKGMEHVCERMLPQIKPFFHYHRIEVRRIDLQGDAATIVGRCFDEEELEYKVRWWLRRLDGRWRLVDYENVTVAMRLSALMSQALQLQPGAPAKAKEISGKFIRLGLATESGDLETALRLANELLETELPGAIREMVFLVKADLHITLDETEEGDAALAEMEKAGSTNPAYFLLRAGRCQSKGELEECIVWSQKYGSSIGHDADSWQMLAQTHQKLGQKMEALRTAQDWLDDYPQSSLAMYSYWQALPEPEQAAKIRPLLAGLPAAPGSFAGFGAGATLNDDAAALKLLIGVMKTLKMTKEDIEEWEEALEVISLAQPEKLKGAETLKPKL